MKFRFHIIGTSVAIILAYLASFLIQQATGNHTLLQATGTILLFCLLPYLYLTAFPWKGISLIQRVFIYIALIFFAIIPIQYILHRALSLPTYQPFVTILGTSLLAIFLLAVATQRSRNTFQSVSFEPREIFNNHWPLIIPLILYAILHIVNYAFYHFIPEWDSYNKLVEIESALRSSQIQTSYRGFFTGASVYLANITSLSPYQLFTVWYIGLQSSLLFALYQFTQEYKLKNQLASVLIILASLAVPVLTMEIDTLRPQNSIVMFLPIYFSLLYTASKTHDWRLWAVTTLMAIAGLNYHEFFTFVFLFHILWLAAELVYSFFHRVNDRKDRTIIGLIVLLLITNSTTLLLQNRMLLYVQNTLKAIITRITDSTWHWWFLSSYNTDGAALDVGWKGWFGAAQYYGYYMSPIIFLIFVSLLVLLVLRFKTVTRDTLVRIALPYLLTFLFFAEFLPRLGVFYLPERFWILISLVTLPLIVPLWSIIEQAKPSKLFSSLLAAIWIIFIAIGIGGSLYIAHGKAALTTIHEYKTANWISKNSPNDAIFITQSANGPMITYFAQRNIVVPPENFFVSPELDTHLEKLVPLYDPESLREQIKVQEQTIQNAFTALIASNFADPGTFITNVSASAKTIQQLREQLQQIEINSKNGTDKAHIYILYSNDKRNTIYADRIWWQKANFFDATLEKFDQAYPKVYDQDGIFIWEVR